MSRSDWWDKNVDRPWCEVQADGCYGRANQTHHRKLRSQGGGNEPENLLRVCAACHSWLHLNVAASVERGFIVRSWDTSATEAAVAADSEMLL